MEITKSKRNGYTLVELLVVVVMFSILSAAAYELFTNQSRINRTQQNFVEMQSNARAALQSIIQDISHTGFGCTDSFAIGQTINGTAEFIIPSDKSFSANAATPDSIIIAYGYKHVGTITSEANATNLLIADATDIAPGTGDNYRKYISFFPYTDPNSFFVGTGNNGNGTTITLDRNIENIRSGAKIFRVTQIEYYVDNGELRVRPVLNPGEAETLVYDVQDFQLAYSDDGDAWDESPSVNEAKNVKVIWTYLLLRSREREPGFQESRVFTLPWNGVSIQGQDLTPGFHYYEIHSQIWLRNVL
ncbi:prepilin-type N-terminal cleavage/methylation domain-containing protein [Desulfomicrobium sp. ZS1]|uniref:PilW family protein n=1 Tax=Desulfomicrobium sp. ZS1 TaxID=2952228 RepID=UPI0020B3C051|nr:prepilin-type N-terminal cleavage/methylation domain-containing protein [Desulfomicrobium sp. ZS1]UTF50240.1 prepilin-type N-terminal cleavage/methylation domain-containing protein [Desulfomicrobium sp. ZS1]